MKKILFILLALLAISATEAQKIKTMIVTGQDGSHWWQGGSDAVKMILENSGLFTVDILVTPATGQSMDSYRPDFKKYDLVVINYGGMTWTEQTRKDFETYVASGKGVVVLHSSVVPMDDWKEYNKMIGLGAWNGRNEKDGPYVYWKENRFVYDYSPGWAGYHGLQHQFTVVNRNTEHPILKGLPTVWRHFKDELYAHLRGPGEHLEILATAFETTGDGTEGRDEPVMWTVNYGKGRVFVSVLGHVGNDPPLRYSMECAGYQVTLLRGAEWAATGKVTQPVPKDFPLEGTCTFRKEFKAPRNAY
jgi:type 1 glutamine amidotransferase